MAPWTSNLFFFSLDGSVLLDTMGIHSVYILQHATSDVWMAEVVDSIHLPAIMTRLSVVHVRREQHNVWVVSPRSHVDRMLAASFPELKFKHLCTLEHAVEMHHGALICRPTSPVFESIAPLERYIQNKTLNQYMVQSPSAACRFVFASGLLSRAIRHPMDRVWHDDGAAVALRSVQCITLSKLEMCMEITPDPALSPSARWIALEDPFVDRSRTFVARLVFDFDISTAGWVKLAHNVSQSHLPDAMTINPLTMQIVVEEFRQECWRWFAENAFDATRMQFADADEQTCTVIRRHPVPPGHLYSPVRFLSSTRTRAIDREYLGAPSLVVLTSL